MKNPLPSKRQFVRAVNFVTAAAVVSWACFGFPQEAQADIATEMTKMFNSSGVMASQTAPGVYQTQNSNIAALGSLEIRSPVRNYQLFNYQAGSLKAGCGGVDARLGSFSWINEEQFKQMLQQIGNNTVGLLYGLAINGVSSLIGARLDMLMKQLQDASNFFGNTCRDAEMLLDGVTGQKSADLYSSCMKIRRLYGDDENQAMESCKDQAPETNAGAAGSGDQRFKDVAQRDVNLVWDALAKTGLTHDQKELYMNLSGTHVIFAKKKDGAGTDNDTTYAGPVDLIKTLEKGNTAPPSTAAAGNVAIDGWWSCDETSDPNCLHPKRITKTFTPFTQLAINALSDLKDAMWSNSKVTDASVQFVNHSSVPIASMLRVGYMSHRDELTQSFINRFSGVIGADFAYNFLNAGLRDVRIYLSNGSNRRGIEASAVKDMLDNIDHALSHLDAQRQSYAAEQQMLNSLVTHVYEVERQMYATLPSGVQNMMAFSNHMSSYRGR